MRNVLVIGGTRFFGQRLVNRLILNGDKVTVASHNFSRTKFNSEVKMLSIEREDETSLASCRVNGPYDLVYDQICYSPTAASLLSKIFAGLTGKLIHTSTQSVYISNGFQKEEDFDYSQGKRLAEAVYFQKARFPITAVRFPFVLGSDDYTGRLDFHIQRIANELPIVAPNTSARTSLISADEAADFLFWVGKMNFSGSINACSKGKVSLAEIIDTIESVLGKRAVVQESGKEEMTSPYSQMDSRYLDTSRAEKLGFSFSNLENWLPALIQERVMTYR